MDLPGALPAVPKHLVWLLAHRSAYGRRPYADQRDRPRFASLSVAGVRFRAYTLAGLPSGVAEIVFGARFAAARPDAGTAGNGMALPAITIAVLGGVAITGGLLVAALLVVWLNAGILLSASTSCRC